MPSWPLACRRKSGCIPHSRWVSSLHRSDRPPRPPSQSRNDSPLVFTLVFARSAQKPGATKNPESLLGIRGCRFPSTAAISLRPRGSIRNSSVAGQVFWLPDHPTRLTFPPLIGSGSFGFRPRSQRRARDGFAPSSLLRPCSRPRNGRDYTRTSNGVNNYGLVKGLPNISLEASRNPRQRGLRNRLRGLAVPHHFCSRSGQPLSAEQVPGSRIGMGNGDCR